MKSVGSPLAAHIAQHVTTLAWCLKVERRVDGAILGFTSHDQDLVISGVTYVATGGVSTSAVETHSDGTVDNTEATGFFNDDGIDEHGIKNGLFDYTRYWLFQVNWADLTMGAIKHKTGWFGEVNWLPSGQFTVELRGLSQGLTQEAGAIFSPLCRADLGDSRCTIPVLPPVWTHNTVYTAGTFCRAATQSTDDLRCAIFECTVGNSSGSSEPTWDVTVGNPTFDGAVTWVASPPWRMLSSVFATGTAKQFTSAPLSIPALSTASDTATINMRDNVSANTTLTVSDGITDVGWTTDYDLRGAGDATGQDAVHYIYDTLVGSALDMTITRTETSITLVNNSGLQASITKTGDTADAIVTSGFATPYMDGGTLTWLDGDNAGVSMEIKTYDPDTGLLKLWLPMVYTIQTGDKFFYYPGCDKKRSTCFNKFSNIANFRGEPDMPGNDKMLSYPDS